MFLFLHALEREEEKIFFYLFFYKKTSAEKAFLSALYKDSHFERVNEIHFRLGLIYKELDDFNASLKHFKLALYDSSSSLSSVTKLESKYKNNIF